jgi:hypothetical protein
MAEDDVAHFRATWCQRPSIGEPKIDQMTDRALVANGRLTGSTAVPGGGDVVDMVTPPKVAIISMARRSFRWAGTQFVSAVLDHGARTNLKFLTVDVQAGRAEGQKKSFAAGRGFSRHLMLGTG